MAKSFAGAYRNNCAFHCVVHQWLSLPEPKIKELFSQYPVFNEIMHEFYQYHQLGETPNVNDFIALNKQLSHPHDREVMWGQVLRNVLRKKLSSIAQSQVADDTLVPDDILGELTKLMGADLAIHASEPLASAQLLPLSVLEIKADNPVWRIELYHSVRGGGHYDFSYGQDSEDIAHNRHYQSGMDEWGRRIPTAGALLYGATNLIGLKEQEQAIRLLVAKNFQQILAKSKQPGAAIEEEQLESLFTLNRAHSPELKPPEMKGAQSATPSLILRATPHKKQSVASTLEPPLRSPDQPRQFIDDDFVKMLELKLKKTDWTYVILSDKKMQLASKANQAKTISIEKQQDAMIFSGTNDSHADIAQAALAYEQTMAQRQQTLTFEINADDQDEAIRFMAELSQNGFDIDKIDHIGCKNEPVPKEKMAEFVKDLIEKAKKHPRSPAPRH